MILFGIDQDGIDAIEHFLGAIELREAREKHRKFVKLLLSSDFPPYSHF